MHSYKVKYNDRCINSESKSSVKFTPAWINSHPNAEMNQLLESACCSRRWWGAGKARRSRRLSAACVQCARCPPASAPPSASLATRRTSPGALGSSHWPPYPHWHSARRRLHAFRERCGSRAAAKRTSQLVQRVSRKQRLQTKLEWDIPEWGNSMFNYNEKA